MGDKYPDRHARAWPEGTVPRQGAASV